MVKHFLRLLASEEKATAVLWCCETDSTVKVSSRLTVFVDRLWSVPFPNYTSLDDLSEYRRLYLSHRWASLCSLLRIV